MSDPCPQCGGRKIIAVGTHEIQCAACATEPEPEPAPSEAKRGSRKQAAADR